jgi:hypothetical protein
MSEESQEITDEMRAVAIQAAILKAEGHCGIASDDRATLGARAEAIVRAAHNAALEPRLYQLAWKLRKWATPLPM